MVVAIAYSWFAGSKGIESLCNVFPYSLLIHSKIRSTMDFLGLGSQHARVSTMAFQAGSSSQVVRVCQGLGVGQN